MCSRSAIIAIAWRSSVWLVVDHPEHIRITAIDKAKITAKH
ncbi:MAG: hypothetical protein ACRC1Z_23870 [Waterburya sp.]